MDEYIKRILAKAEFTGNFQDSYPTAQIHALLDTIPAADVAPVVRGEWGRWSDDSNTFDCSHCGMAFTIYEGTPEDNDYNYCPNCGASMRPEQEKEGK